MIECGYNIVKQFPNIFYILLPLSPLISTVFAATSIDRHIPNK
jgi:hypothetical protein